MSAVRRFERWAEGRNVAKDIVRAQALLAEVFDRTRNGRVFWAPTVKGEDVAAFAGRFTYCCVPARVFASLILRNWENRESFEVLLRSTALGEPLV